MLPTRMWDWSMRKMGYLSPTDLAVTPVAAPPVPVAKPASVLHAN
jgi:hypothetical protein